MGALLSLSRRKKLAAVAAVSVIAVAGCSDSSGGDVDSPQSQKSTDSPSADGSKESNNPGSGDQSLAEVRGNGITLTVTSAVRNGGGFLTVSGTVNNGTGGIWVAGEWKSDETELKKNGGSMAGASLVDAAGKKKYLVLRDTSGRCLCTKFEGGIERGKTVDWFAQFPSPPSEITKADFQVGTMPPATIEISEG
ncbi:hypothetical protein ACFWMQ_02175 [Streptomyces sp. NPDC058372]|uniref:hypothetical protein n=1 Tax=Streptomyces sp. NPDC058372 TaxID=3346464 RepID=UPI0036694A1E